MAGIAQADRARRDASGSPSRPKDDCRDRPVRSHSSVAPPFNVELSPIDVRDASEIEQAITTFAREPNGGLIVTGSVAATAHRKLIFLLAARHRLASVYAFRTWVTEGGLISYGPDLDDQYRRAATYGDRLR